MTSTTMPSGEHQITAVVLTPGEDGLGEKLESLLDARAWRAIEVHDLLLAMAELCRRQRTRVLRATWGLQADDEIVLVVADPQAWPDAQMAQLRGALRRYAPGATVWTYTDCVLSPLDQSPPAAVPPPAPPVPPLDAEPRPISREEIDMLLEVEPGKPFRPAP